MADKEVVSTKSSWICPFCNHAAFLRRDDKDSAAGWFVHPLIQENAYGFRLAANFCPNESCKKTEVKLELFTGTRGSEGKYFPGKLVQQWNLMPRSNAKPFPDYIPAAILADYQEACLIATLSPKASATLSRRCLQGMIRDFWGISKKRLKDEIDALEGKVDSETWKAIDSVRSIGNIGAHMETDINLIIDVEPDEATLLIGLIETLLTEWYVSRQERQLRMAKISAVAAEKREAQLGSGAQSGQEPMQE
jgi:hypothetical protein